MQLHFLGKTIRPYYLHFFTLSPTSGCSMLFTADRSIDLKLVFNSSIFCSQIMNNKTQHSKSNINIKKTCNLQYNLNKELYKGPFYRWNKVKFHWHTTLHHAICMRNPSLFFSHFLIKENHLKNLKIKNSTS